MNTDQDAPLTTSEEERLLEDISQPTQIESGKLKVRPTEINRTKRPIQSPTQIESSKLKVRPRAPKIPHDINEATVPKEAKAPGGPDGVIAHKDAPAIAQDNPSARRALTMARAATPKKTPAHASGVQEPQEPAIEEKPAITIRQRHKPRNAPYILASWFQSTWHHEITVGHAIMVAVPILGIVLLVGLHLANAASDRADSSNQKAGEPPHPLANIAVSEDFLSRLDASLQSLRDGNAKMSVQELTLLQEQNPKVPSLSYLIALAALQAGNTDLAAKTVDASISKGERVSDSLALKAVLESQKARNPNSGSFGDPKVNAETYLRQAILADPANPAPCIELATLLRYAKRDDEAAALLQAARARLNPVDSFAVVETTLALMKLQNLSDEELPKDIRPDKDISSMFSAAYIAIRKSDFAQAKTLLNMCKERLPADLNSYLINDPAFRRFVLQPELSEFFK